MDASFRRRRFSALLLAFAFSIESASADLVPSFVWGFNTFKATTLQECARLQIFVGTSPGLSAQPQPPFTLIAYEPSGLATVQSVGTDLSNLWWNVDHAAGVQLVLSMTDAAGNAGGVAEDIYSVAAGGGTACHPTNPTSQVSVTTNTTKVLNSCDILPLKISGGKKPYSITVATIGSPAVTNVTMGDAYDTFQWVNRAPPNTRLIASINDASGVYAPATALLTTAGSADLACGGRESEQIDSTGQASAVQSGTAAVTATNTATSSGSSNSGKTSTSTIIGGAVGGVILIGALVTGLLFYLRRRRARAVGPRPFMDDNTPYGGFGMNMVGGTHGGAAAEEITPFVMAAGQASPYMDHTPSQATAPNSSFRDHTSYYSNAYSTSASETTIGRSPSLQPSTPFTPFTPGPRIDSPDGSSMYDPYVAYANGPPSPSVYSTTTSQPPIPGRGNVMSRSATGLESPAAGPSGSGNGYTVANPGVQEAPRRDVKRGSGPSASRQTSVYQHEDISDVVELPPAYKERD